MNLLGIQATNDLQECREAVDDGACGWLFATNWGAGYWVTLPTCLVGHRLVPRL